MRGVSRCGDNIGKCVQVRRTPPPPPVVPSPSHSTLNDGVLSGYILRIIYINTCRRKEGNRKFYCDGDCFSVYHRAGYCNSTALVEAKPRAKILSYMSLPPPPLPFTFHLLSRKVGSLGGLNNTVLRFAKCLIQSFIASFSSEDDWLE